MGLLPVFSSRSFMASGHTFKSLIHVELIFVTGLRKWSSFMILCSPLIRDFAFWVSVTQEVQFRRTEVLLSLKILNGKFQK